MFDFSDQSRENIFDEVRGSQLGVTDQQSSPPRADLWVGLCDRIVCDAARTVACDPLVYLPLT